MVLGIAAGFMAINMVPAMAQAPKIGDPPEAKNMRLVGSHDLQTRSAYQPLIHKIGARYIAFIGHHGGTATIPKPVNSLNGQAEFNGTSILDVTDPKAPKYLAHIPGEEGLGEQGGAQMVRVCDGKTLPKGDPNAVYLLRPFGNRAHDIYNVADPAHPKLVVRVSDKLANTHKSWWECETGIAYLVSGVEGWRVRRMAEVFDLSDPAKPVKIRDFGLVGMQPGASGAVPVNMHGMIALPKENRVYFGYGTNKGGVLQIIDREKLIKGPKEPTVENLQYPIVAQMETSPLVGAHTVLPLLKMPVKEFTPDKTGKSRDIVMIVNETMINECNEARQMVWFVDATVESKPTIVSHFNVPEGPGKFCERGGRFGAHSSNEDMSPIYYKKIAFFTWFNAGVRAVDIRDPFEPKEIGYFIPPITEATTQRCVKVDGKDRCKVAIQSNNVETDDRGYIYVVDRANTGLHILELTGDAKAVAEQP
jgi:hypothetical protein